ncbi:hypothetical protein KKF84_10890, partial [Myxococcota bacterium]|nr:hypothetical protein [Myxococcota bacterium]MBU1535817.1 hypothetical protein [Myxococcota bacterium]
LTFLLTVMINYLDDYSPSFTQDNNSRLRIRNLTNLLKDKGVTNHRNIARKFVDLKADTHLMEFLSHYDSDKVSIYVNFMHDLLSINRSASSIAMAIQSVKRIVVALRSYSHVKQEIPEWTNIHDVIETSLIILANKLKHRITVIKNYGDIPPVRVYGDELSQVWTNIIMNAAQAIEGEGTITISTEILEEWLLVSINDTGAGVPEHIQKKIFEAFFTTKKKGEGSGLGLGIVSRIVNDRHKGRIELDSTPGSTTFRIYLPLNVEVVESPKEES